MKLGLAEFAASLREIRAEEFGAAKLNPILASLDLSPGSVEPYLQWRPGSYTRNLVCKFPEFEVMVLCWDAGSVSAIHDHSGQQCWFVSHAGRFVVEDFELAAGGLRPGHARVVPTTIDSNVTVGMPDYRAPGANEIHRVSVPAGERAISIHVYAKPLSHCLVFDESNQRCIDRALEYDNVPRERILIA
jgi:predicted metal-dependent enzyme (double-stranded beta helix superfamily)